MSIKRGVKFINDEGILLVFPINNRKEPNSLWQCLYPRSKMRWEWDESGDNRLAGLWHLREQLSRSGKVVYVKWYQGRATFFSRDAFVRFLSAQRSFERRGSIENPEAAAIIEVLEMDSPLSTKQIKEAVDLQGRSLETQYNRAMKELWSNGLIVAFGEVEDSSFPSLAVGATKNLFEDLWQEAKRHKPDESLEWLRRRLGEENLFFKYLLKNSRRPIAEPDELLIADRPTRREMHDPRFDF
jgi:hypothetical protein